MGTDIEAQMESDPPNLTSNPTTDIEAQLLIPTDVPQGTQIRQRSMMSTGRDTSNMTHSPDLENQSTHSYSKSRGVSMTLARRYYKVITCAIGITLVLVTILGCG